jgi:excisionase family DNA binding protein
MPNRKPPLPKEKILVPLADRFSLSPEQTCALTGIGVSRIREAIRDGKLDAHRNGASIVILPDDIRVWLKALPAVESQKNRPG